jgi:opacity protein-like surface antigen
MSSRGCRHHEQAFPLVPALDEDRPCRVAPTIPIPHTSYTSYEETRTHSAKFSGSPRPLIVGSPLASKPAERFPDDSEVHKFTLEVFTNMSMKVLLLLLLITVTFVPSSLFAQAFEINPYAGYIWTGKNNEVGSFLNNQLLGVRGGGYVSHNLELGLNYSWNNHFQPSHSNETANLAGDLGFPQGSVRAQVWEAEFTYHFAQRSALGSHFKPYAVAGFGTLRTTVKDPDTFVLNTRSFTKPCGCLGYAANDVLDDGDKFFTFSYGGGAKWNRVWGKMGFFGDFRGRTIPNFFNGHGTNSPELSAGLTFAWGEK